LALLAVVPFAPLWVIRRPTGAEAALGLAVSGLAVYGAYLGGQMVYNRGVGVRALPKLAPNGIRQSPPVLSASAPATFVRDAFGGLRWLLQRTARALLGTQMIGSRMEITIEGA
jgi:hypothetical protein